MQRRHRKHAILQLLSSVLVMTAMTTPGAALRAEQPTFPTVTIDVHQPDLSAHGCNAGLVSFTAEGNEKPFLMLLTYPREPSRHKLTCYFSSDDDVKLLSSETAIADRGNNRLLAIRRPPQHTPTAPDARSALVSESHDGGHTWTTLGLSNFPLAPSQPFAGRLSTGQNYLLTNSLEEGRCLPSIAVTGPEGGLFRRIFKLRHQQWPRRRLFGNAVGKPTEWSYPFALEHNGNLHIAYAQGKEGCVLSIVPIEVLAV